MDADDRILIETPEHIHLSLPIAGLGSRALAALLDHLLLLAFNLAVLSLVLVTAGGLSGLGMAAEASKFVIAGAALVLFAINWGYFVASEMFLNGQTLGKRAVRLRVVRMSGGPVGFVESAIRNLIRGVDWLPGLYGIGMICVLVSRESRRLGDYAAGTVVIKDQPSDLPSHLFLERGEGSLPPDLMERIRVGLARLAPGEFDYLVYVLRRPMPRHVAEPLITQVAISLMQRMGIPAPEPLPDGFHRTLLQAIATMYSQKSL